MTNINPLKESLKIFEERDTLNVFLILEKNEETDGLLFLQTVKFMNDLL